MFPQQIRIKGILSLYSVKAHVYKEMEKMYNFSSKNKELMNVDQLKINMLV